MSKSSIQDLSRARESAFDHALTFTLRWEGRGVSRAPHDPGGLTKAGVTQRTWRTWARARPGLPRSVADATLDELRELYRARYWEEAGCPCLPRIVAVAHFDTAVNLGVRRAGRLLQRAVGVRADGMVGPQTVGAVGAADSWATVARYQGRRIAYYLRLARRRPALRRFLPGWIARVADLLTSIRA